MDELNGMTYLDHVIREVLRLHAPVTNTDRVAKEDVTIPLGVPFIDRHGVKRHEFRQVIPFAYGAALEIADKGFERETWSSFRFWQYIG